MGTMEEIKDLENKIYDLTWAGKYWGKEGALCLASVLFKKQSEIGNERKASIQRASTYFSAANAARCSMKSPLLPFWALCLVYCFAKAAWYAGHFKELCDQKKEKPSIDNLHVLASIYLRHPSRKQRAKSEAFLEEALGRCDREIKDPLDNLGWKSLLRVTLARILESKGEIANALHHGSIAAMEAEKPGVDPTKATQVLQEYGTMLCRHNKHEPDPHATHIFNIALEIAEKHNLKDGIIKIKGEMKKHCWKKK